MVHRPEDGAQYSKDSAAHPRGTQQGLSPGPVPPQTRVLMSPARGGASYLDVAAGTARASAGSTLSPRAPPSLDLEETTTSFSNTPSRHSPEAGEGIRDEVKQNIKAKRTRGGQGKGPSGPSSADNVTLVTVVRCTPDTVTVTEEKPSQSLWGWAKKQFSWAKSSRTGGPIVTFEKLDDTTLVSAFCAVMNADWRRDIVTVLHAISPELRARLRLVEVVDIASLTLEECVDFALCNINSRALDGYPLTVVFALKLFTRATKPDLVLLTWNADFFFGVEHCVCLMFLHRCAGSTPPRTMRDIRRTLEDTDECEFAEVSQNLLHTAFVDHRPTALRVVACIAPTGHFAKAVHRISSSSDLCVLHKERIAILESPDDWAAFITTAMQTDVPLDIIAEHLVQKTCFIRVALPAMNLALERMPDRRVWFQSIMRKQWLTPMHNSEGSYQQYLEISRFLRNNRTLGDAVLEDLPQELLKTDKFTRLVPLLRAFEEECVTSLKRHAEALAPDDAEGLFTKLLSANLEPCKEAVGMLAAILLKRLLDKPVPRIFSDIGGERHVVHLLMGTDVITKDKVPDGWDDVHCLFKKAASLRKQVESRANDGHLTDTQLSELRTVPGVFVRAAFEKWSKAKEDLVGEEAAFLDFAEQLQIKQPKGLSGLGIKNLLEQERASRSVKPLSQWKNVVTGFSAQLLRTYMELRNVACIAGELHAEANNAMSNGAVTSAEDYAAWLKEYVRTMTDAAYIRMADLAKDSVCFGDLQKLLSRVAPAEACRQIEGLRNVLSGVHHNIASVSRALRECADFQQVLDTVRAMQDTRVMLDRLMHDSFDWSPVDKLCSVEGQEATTLMRDAVTLAKRAKACVSCLADVDAELLRSFFKLYQQDFCTIMRGQEDDQMFGRFRERKLAASEKNRSAMVAFDTLRMAFYVSTRPLTRLLEGKSFRHMDEALRTIMGLEPHHVQIRTLDGQLKHVTTGSVADDSVKILQQAHFLVGACSLHISATPACVDVCLREGKRKEQMSASHIRDLVKDLKVVGFVAEEEGDLEPSAAEFEKVLAKKGAVRKLQDQGYDLALLLESVVSLLDKLRDVGCPGYDTFQWAAPPSPYAQKKKSLEEIRGVLRKDLECWSQMLDVIGSYSPSLALLPRRQLVVLLQLVRTARREAQPPAPDNLLAIYNLLCYYNDQLSWDTAVQCMTEQLAQANTNKSTDICVDVSVAGALASRLIQPQDLLASRILTPCKEQRWAQADAVWRARESGKPTMLQVKGGGLFPSILMMYHRQLGRLPHPCEVLLCTLHTTGDALRSFMRRWSPRRDWPELVFSVLEPQQLAPDVRNLLWQLPKGCAWRSVLLWSSSGECGENVELCTVDCRNPEWRGVQRATKHALETKWGGGVAAVSADLPQSGKTTAAHRMAHAEGCLFATVLVSGAEGLSDGLSKVHAVSGPEKMLLHLDVVESTPQQDADWAVLQYVFLCALPHKGGLCVRRPAERVVVEVPCVTPGTAVLTLLDLLPALPVPHTFCYTRFSLTPHCDTRLLFEVRRGEDTEARQVVHVCHLLEHQSQVDYAMPRMDVETVDPAPQANDPEEVLARAMPRFDPEPQAQYSLHQKVRCVKYMGMLLRRSHVLLLGWENENPKDAEFALKLPFARFTTAANALVAALDFVVQHADAGSGERDLAHRFSDSPDAALDSRTLLVPHRQSFSVVSTDTYRNKSYGVLQALLRRLPVVPPAAKKMYTDRRASWEQEGVEPCTDMRELLALLHNRDGITKLVEWVGSTATPDKVGRVLEEYGGHLVTGAALHKMLEVHLKLEAGLPVYVMGESGVGKTCAMRLLCLLRDCSLQVINVHGGMTAHDIRKEAAASIAKAAQGKRCLVMLDEANSSPMCLTQLLGDRMLCGERLPDSLQVLCMVNPIRYKSGVMQRIDSEGLPTKVLPAGSHQELVYTVYPPSESVLIHMVQWHSPCRYYIDPNSVKGAISNRTRLGLGRVQVTDETLMIENSMHSVVTSDLFAMLTGNRYNKEAELMYIRTLLVTLLGHSQRYYRELYEDDSVVSLRVISRVAKCLIVGMHLDHKKHKHQQKHATAGSVSDGALEAGISIALFVTYAARLAPGRRREYYNHMEEAWGQVAAELRRVVPENLVRPTHIGTTFLSHARWLCDEMDIQPTEGIAKNDGFVENVLMLFIAVYHESLSGDSEAPTPVPLYIIGMPGTSKSLALDRLVSATASHKFLGGEYPQLIKCCMQCSRDTTADGIRQLAESAAKTKLDLMRQGRKDSVVLVFEEIGLAARSDHLALMELHSLMDRGITVTDHDGTVHTVHLPIVGLSNTRLDAAKMDRGYTVLRSTPTDSDITLILRDACISDNSSPEVTGVVMHAVSPAAKEFAARVLQRDGVSERGGMSFHHFFGMRDLFGMASFIRGQLADPTTRGASPRITPHLARWAVAMNLSGFPDAEKQAELVHMMTQAWTSSSKGMQAASWRLLSDEKVMLCDTCVRGYAYEALRRAGHRPGTDEWDPERLLMQRFDQATGPGDFCTGLPDLTPPVSQLLAWGFSDTQGRNTMLLSRGGQGLSLLFSKALLHPKNCEVVFGPDSSSPSDVHTATQLEGLEAVRRCMRTGKDAVLVNFTTLYEPLYDLLNKRYMTDTTGTYARIGFGAHTINCTVKEGFHLVLVDDEDRVEQLSPALLNRMRKVHLNCDLCLDDHQSYLLQQLRKAFTAKHGGEEYCLIPYFMKVCGEQTLESLVLHTDSDVVSDVVAKVVDATGPLEAISAKLGTMEVSSPDIAAMYRNSYDHETHESLVDAATAVYLSPDDEDDEEAGKSLRLVALVSEVPAEWSDKAIEEEEELIDLVGPITVLQAENLSTGRVFQAACKDFLERNQGNHKACLVLKVANLREMEHRYQRLVYQADEMISNTSRRHVIFLVHSGAHSTMTFFRGWTAYAIDRVCVPKEHEPSLVSVDHEFGDLITIDVLRHVLTGSTLRALYATLRYQTSEDNIKAARLDLLATVFVDDTHLLQRVCDELLSVEELQGQQWVGAALQDPAKGTSVSHAVKTFVQHTCLNVLKSMMPCVDANANLRLLLDTEVQSLWTELLPLDVAAGPPGSFTSSWAANVLDAQVSICCAIESQFPFSRAVVNRLTFLQSSAMKEGDLHSALEGSLDCLLRLTPEQLRRLCHDWCLYLAHDAHAVLHGADELCADVGIAIFYQDYSPDATLEDLASFTAEDGDLIVSCMKVAALLPQHAEAACRNNTAQGVPEQLFVAAVQEVSNGDKCAELARSLQQLYLLLEGSDEVQREWNVFTETQVVIAAFRQVLQIDPPATLLQALQEGDAGNVASALAGAGSEAILQGTLPFLGVGCAASVHLLLEGGQNHTPATLRCLLGCLLRDAAQAHDIDAHPLASLVATGGGLSDLMCRVWADMQREQGRTLRDMQDTLEMLSQGQSHVSQSLRHATIHAAIGRLVDKLKRMFTGGVGARAPAGQTRDFCGAIEGRQWLQSVVVPAFESTWERAFAQEVTCNYTQSGGVAALIASDAAQQLLPQELRDSKLLLLCTGVPHAVPGLLDNMASGPAADLSRALLAPDAEETFRRQWLVAYGNACPVFSAKELYLFVHVLAAASAPSSPWHAMLLNPGAVAGRYVVGSSEGTCFEALEAVCESVGERSTYAYSCPAGHVYTTNACSHVRQHGTCPFFRCTHPIGGSGEPVAGNRRLGTAPDVLRDWRAGQYQARHGGAEPCEQGFVPYAWSVRAPQLRNLPRAMVLVLHSFSAAALFLGLLLQQQRSLVACGRDAVSAAEVLQQLRDCLDEVKTLTAPGAVDNTDVLKALHGCIATVHARHAGGNALASSRDERRALEARLAATISETLLNQRAPEAMPDLLPLHHTPVPSLEGLSAQPGAERIKKAVAEYRHSAHAAGVLPDFLRFQKHVAAELGGKIKQGEAERMTLREFISNQRWDKDSRRWKRLADDYLAAAATVEEHVTGYNCVVFSEKNIDVRLSFDRTLSLFLPSGSDDGLVACAYFEVLAVRYNTFVTSTLGSAGEPASPYSLVHGSALGITDMEAKLVDLLPTIVSDDASPGSLEYHCGDELVAPLLRMACLLELDPIATQIEHFSFADTATVVAFRELPECVPQTYAHDLPAETASLLQSVRRPQLFLDILRVASLLVREARLTTDTELVTVMPRPVRESALDERLMQVFDSSEVSTKLRVSELCGAAVLLWRVQYLRAGLGCHARFNRTPTEEEEATLRDGVQRACALGNTDGQKLLYALSLFAMMHLGGDLKPDCELSVVVDAFVASNEEMDVGDYLDDLPVAVTGAVMRAYVEACNAGRVSRRVQDTRADYWVTAGHVAKLRVGREAREVPVSTLLDDTEAATTAAPDERECDIESSTDSDDDLTYAALQWQADTTPDVAQDEMGMAKSFINFEVQPQGLEVDGDRSKACDYELWRILGMSEEQRLQAIERCSVDTNITEVQEADRKMKVACDVLQRTVTMVVPMQGQVLRGSPDVAFLTGRFYALKPASSTPPSMP